MKNHNIYSQINKLPFFEVRGVKVGIVDNKVVIIDHENKYSKEFVYKFVNYLILEGYLTSKNVEVFVERKK